jgi:hypothetical protein
MGGITGIFSETKKFVNCDYCVGVRASWMVSAMWPGRVGGGASGGVGEGRDAELDGVVATGGDLVHLGEFGAGAGEADFQSFSFSKPTVVLGFGDAGDEVVADLFEAGPGGGVGTQQWATETTVFVDAGGVVGAAAVAHGDLAAFEVPDEFGPFLVGRDPVFLAGAQRTPAGDECPVAVDHLFGVDGVDFDGDIPRGGLALR